LGGFNKVELTTHGKLTIEQADKESIVIEIDDNLMPLVDTDISSGKLSIGFKKGYDVRLEGGPNFNLTVRDLNSISNIGLGSIGAYNICTEKLEFKLGSLGSINIENIEVEQSVMITLKSHGSVNVYNIIAEEITTEISGLGSVRLSGEVDKQTVTANGLGSYYAEELQSSECTVTLDAGGVHTDAPACGVTVNASDILNVTLVGDVDVCYKGDPEVTKEVSGAGTVRAIQ